jgi:hypothetical protein
MKVAKKPKKKLWLAQLVAIFSCVHFWTQEKNTVLPPPPKKRKTTLHKRSGCKITHFKVSYGFLLVLNAP